MTDTDYINEIQRKHDISDMMLTMHSLRRDQLHHWSFLIDISLLVSSFLLLMVEFTDPTILQGLKLNVSIIGIVGRIATILVFIMSLVILRADWKGKAEKHKKACESLTDMKLKARLLLNNGDISEEKFQEFERIYSIICNNISPIDERLFNKLKAKHLFKVELSKLISSCPGCPVWFLKAKLVINGMKAAYKK